MNYRAIAQANMLHSVTTDVIYASFNFFLIRKIARTDDSLVAWFGYVCGSAVGTYSGITLSQLIMG